MGIEDIDRLMHLISEGNNAEIASIMKNELNCLRGMIGDLSDSISEIDHRINGAIQSLQTLIDIKKGGIETGRD